LSIIKKDNLLTIRTPESNYFANLPNIHNMWIPFWEIIDNNFYFNFYSAQVFWKYTTKNIINLDKEKSKQFIIWLDLKLNNSDTKNCELWQVIISFNNIILWTSLLQKNNKLKNQVPRENIKM
jgi:NOL1/NOP2/fmu family ribosome biogenesis protein